MPTYEQIKKDTLKGGVTLYRHYDIMEDPEVHCGKLALWNQIIDEMSVDSFGYYNQLDGTNKFLRKVEVHCYSLSLPYPDAKYGGQVTYRLDNGRSRITCPYADPGQYWFKAAMSHEFGHAYDNWIRLTSDPSIQDVRNWWEREITVNDVLYNDTNPQYPWKRQDGGVEKPWEQFANSWRILFGTVGTRGNVENVVPGFMDSTKLTGLKRQMQLLPETLAMAIAYGGIKPGTFQAVSNGFIFQLHSDFEIGHTDYSIWWYRKGNTNWTQWSPRYTRD